MRSETRPRFDATINRLLVECSTHVGAEEQRFGLRGPLDAATGQVARGLADS